MNQPVVIQIGVAFLYLSLLEYSVEFRLEEEIDAVVHAWLVVGHPGLVLVIDEHVDFDSA